MEKQEFLGQLEASGVQVRQALDRFMGNEELFLSFLAKLPGRMGFEEMLQALEAGPDHGGAAGDPHYHRRQRKGCAVQRGAWGGGLTGEAGGPPHGAGAGVAVVREAWPPKTTILDCSQEEETPHPVNEPRRTLLPTELTMEESEELARRWFRKLEGLCRFRPALALDRCRQLGVLTTCLARGYVARHPEGPLTEDDAALIGMAAPFCDIGMLGLPDPEDHREEGDPRHTILGHELLAVEGDLPLLRYGAEIALWHHRNADGSGWPQDMDGEAPLSAMLVHTALRLQHYLHYYQGYEDALDRAVRTMKGEVGSILTEEMAGLLEETQQLRAALL